MPSQEWRMRLRRRSETRALNDIGHDAGNMNIMCTFCGALMWATENESLCCARGQVTLPPLPALPVFMQVPLAGSDTYSRTFGEKIRANNTSLAFASLGAQEGLLPPGVYCFRIRGEIYHSIGTILPNESLNEQPRFAQICIYDTENEISNRMGWNEQLNPVIVQELQQFLHQANPFVQVNTLFLC